MVALMVLSGCAAEAPAPGRSPTSSGKPSPSAEVALRPVAAFDIGCESVVDPGIASTVVGAATLAEPAFSLSARRIALLEDGGLSCIWLGSDKQIALSVVALPDAADMFDRASVARANPMFPYGPVDTSFDLFDAALVSCDDGTVTSGYQCTWHVLSGDVWIVVGLTGVPDSDVVVPVPRDNPDTSRKPLVPVAEGSASLVLVESVVASLEQAPRIDVSHRPRDIGSCSELIDAGAIGSTLGVAISSPQDVIDPDSTLPSAAPHLGGSMADFSMQRLGFAECSIATTDPDSQWSASVSILDDVDWRLEAPYGPPRGTRESFDDGSLYHECFSDEGGVGCFVTVVSGDTTIVVYLGDSDDLAIVRAIAASVLARA